MPLPTYAKLPFVVRLMLDPVRALDLLDKHDVPDHTKIVPFVVLVGVFALKVLGNPFTIAELAIIVPASFGAAMYRSFLRSKQLHVNSSEYTSTSLIRKILDRRNADEGVDPTDG